ncbi:Plasmodium variant antigen protein Cir/Yir/Bir, putative [Plasmodium berghei]|uniref:Plasmodium variant antigen protein Cir/Yir/Bir, putative n=1 Tax=Plasmodium berghei TaxID=5821 RepID=A0A1D3L6F1_PLABE|nr:Plasmodium variant antigen protein Cir/Yir/Bir, putative [Plasmodium berghei]
MHSAFGGSTSDCEKCSNKANKFVEKYEKLYKDYNNTEDSSYIKILSTLSTDYNNLKNKCKNAQDSNFSTLPEIKTKQLSVETSERASVQNFDVTSSISSIVSKFIPVLSTFGTISIFGGISYKVNNKELKNITFKSYFNYIYVNVKKKTIHFLTFYIVFVIWISEPISKTKFKRKNKKYKGENELLIYDSKRVTISGIIGIEVMFMGPIFGLGLSIISYYI